MGKKKKQKQEPTSHPFLPHNPKFLDIINLHPGSNISQTNHVTLEGQEESKTISYVIVTKPLMSFSMWRESSKQVSEVDHVSHLERLGQVAASFNQDLKASPRPLIHAAQGKQLFNSRPNILTKTYVFQHTRPVPQISRNIQYSLPTKAAHADLCAAQAIPLVLSCSWLAHKYFKAQTSMRNLIEQFGRSVTAKWAAIK